MKPQERQITSCMARARQHARPSHKHCKACAKQMRMHHGHVSIPVCTISILWNFHTNPYQFSETTSGNNSVTVPVYTSRTHKLRVAGHGVGNTRARRTNTAKRAPNMLVHRGHVPVHVCTISILWNFRTYQCADLNCCRLRCQPLHAMSTPVRADPMHHTRTP